MALATTTLTDAFICTRLQYDEANKEVAILCNHQKGVSKNHDTAMAKLEEKKEVLKSELKEASGAAAARIKCVRCAWLGRGGAQH